jgi:hypothetical protein
MLSQLHTHGYTIIPNVLSPEEITNAKNMFYQWIEQIPDIQNFHTSINPHGVFRYHQVGHQTHAWYIRTRPQVQKPFQDFYQCQDLIVSYDGCNWFNEDFKHKDDTCWTHTDQAPKLSNFECLQGFVSLTNNHHSSLVVYEGSHLLHSKYFQGNDSGKNWQLIDPQFLDTIQDTKRILKVSAGDLVLWDSRTFHQNQYGYPNCEDRLVQYVCYLPRKHSHHTPKVQEQRKKYFQELRTTSHWPCPIRANSLQPSGKDNKIDYSALTKPQLNQYTSDIMKLI